MMSFTFQAVAKGKLLKKKRAVLEPTLKWAEPRLSKNEERVYHQAKPGMGIEKKNISF